MSIRAEQYRSLVRTRDLLRALSLNSGPTRKKDIQAEARACLRHFPFLDERGAPMFSQDPFECPVINERRWGDE